MESLDHIHTMLMERRLLRPLFRHYERTARKRQGLTLDFVAAHWRPPLVPRMAYDLEWEQIHALGLKPLISITDHDNIQAPLLLRTLPAARDIPVSLEWTVPFGTTAFHLGIHNLPSASAEEWVERLAAYTKHPEDAVLRSLMHELDAQQRVMTVLNHPLWDLYAIGKHQHRQELLQFLGEYEDCLHALELNGLRHADENREVIELAQAGRYVLISGGDRHGVEPNANINLTNASTFFNFVQEIRIDRRSHILFLEQYRRPWEERILGSTLDAIMDHPSFTPGWQRWDERAFHPNAEGIMQPLSELWAEAKPPIPLRLAIGAVRLSRHGSVSKAMRWCLHRVPNDTASMVNREIA